ncbi:hypothetical protein DXG03_000919 [Asterophora parasitica]|uniref:BTB domain-containing protein n=1 Tax=Asterophora parasitica TaxID=117018 RepID=A0A9P7G5G7_9AGAR|nr:hypothetical protein DXG03_000919 [Asterophora parasitica]
MLSVDDFSTNRFSQSGANELTKAQLDLLSPSRHPDLCFNDGNLAVLTGGNYFLVHQGLLCRHSAPLECVIESLEGKQVRFLEGRLVLELTETSNDVYYFLLSIYDGISALKYDINDFGVVSAILRLATTYEVKHLRADILRGLSYAWPRNLAHWELREARLLSTTGVYEPHDDLLNLLRGKEHGSRFLSTFIVNELEGREPSTSCIYRMEPDGARRRICQAAFEAITFEILRDINGTVCQHNSDPLFAIMDSELMQTREDLLGRAHPSLRACEYCRSEFGAAVDHAREDFWQRLPLWFGVDGAA